MDDEMFLFAAMTIFFVLTILAVFGTGLALESELQAVRALLEGR